MAKKTDDAQTETKEVEEAPKEVEEAVTLPAVGTLPENSLKDPLKLTVRPLKIGQASPKRKVVIFQPPWVSWVSTRC